MEEPEVKPKQIPARALRAGVHRIQIADTFFLVRGVDYEGDLEGTRDIEYVIVRWEDGGEWKRRQFDVGEIVTTLPRVLFKIPEHKFVELQAKVDKLNKRAARRSLTPIYFEALETIEQNIYHHRYMEDHSISEERWLKLKENQPYNSDYWKEVRAFRMVKIVGESPHYNGWRAIAVLEHLKAGTLVHAIGEHEVPEKYRENDNFCDHCKAKRRRKKTLVIHHDNGETKRIGLNCAVDFVGTKSASQLVGNAEFWETFMRSFSEAEEGGWRTREPEEFGTMGFLAWAAQSIRQKGWLPRSRSDDGIPTADDALWLMLPKSNEKEAEKKEREERGVPVEIDFQRAEKALEWARAFTDTSDFGHNIRILSTPDWFHIKKSGYIAYFVQGHLRALAEKEQKRQEKREADENPSEWVGEVGEKVEVEAVCISIRTIRGQEWDSFMYKFLDGEGNHLVWFTSTGFSLQEWVAEGKTYSIRARIKSHDEYKDVKATKLTRATFPDVKKAKKAGMTPEEYLNERKSA